MLHSVLKINDQVVGMFYARRIEHLDLAQNNDDAISTYVVRIEYLDNRSGPFQGQVTHRYGDGAWALVAKALNEAHLDLLPS